MKAENKKIVKKKKVVFSENTEREALSNIE